MGKYMKTFSGMMLSLMIGLAVLLTGLDEASAARLGGGKSFGSKPSYSTPYSSPSRAVPSAPSHASQQNQTVRDSMSRRGGFMGMLGGLALGGLLGAMFFGGAFEGINLMDILLFAVVAFVLFKLFTARRPAPQAVAAEGAYQPKVSRFDTDVMSGNAARPGDFDEPAFMHGAKVAYQHLQQAWDEGQLSEIRALCTDKVFAELQDQIKQRQGFNRTELLQIDLHILDVRDVGSDREVSVQFDVLLREEPGAAPIMTHEIWHFVRSKFSKQPTWFLDGIQQMEA